MRCTGFLVSRLPLALRFLIRMFEKSRSRKMFWPRRLELSGSSVTLITSASPLGLAVKYITLDPAVPCVRSYSLSRVQLVTLNRL